MKSNRRSLRRWKTFNAKEKRKAKLTRSWGTVPHPRFLEHPSCDCWMCNKRKMRWPSHKTIRRQMRNGEREAIREYYKESDGVISLIG